jgi:carboxypeptidase C (cathepsin A)
LICFIGLITFAGSAAAFAAASSDKKQEEKPTESKSEDKNEKSVPKEEASATHHTVQIGGEEIAYTATAGTLLIHEGDDPVASMFYVAYTRDGAPNLDRRPVTFFYNGGPGSATIWLHMGSYGPRIVETPDANPSGPPPYRLVNNPDSLLDKTDLVFIDAVSTGFSRIVGKGKGEDFFNVDGDVQAFAKFITRYVTLNRRWNSPKVLFGESYGTPRSAALVHELQHQGMFFNGVILLSSVLNYATLHSAGLDDALVNMLPSYAAIAWYHQKLPNRPDNLKKFLQEVRDFASGEYAQALARGQSRTDEQTDAIAKRLHELTGLSESFLKECNLRVSPSRFRKELLRDQGRTVGRLDARFLGFDFDNAGDSPDFDPSSTAILGAYSAAFNSYVVDELNYRHDTPYQVRSSEIRRGIWDFEHKLPDYRRMQQAYPLFYTIDDLAQAIRENPSLKVLSANGYFDLATPFFGAERDLNQMELDRRLRGNVTFTYYESGHMVYLNADVRKAFRADLEKFYDITVPKERSSATK